MEVAQKHNGQQMQLPLVRAGNEDLWIEARGNFEAKVTTGYIPTPDSEQLRVALPTFEGPLDLLLYLIRKHAMDLFDIPIQEITKHYLDTIEAMRSLNIDIAGEFIVTAAELARLKSWALLPRDDDELDDDEDDPRLVLIRRLMDYQRFVEASETLATRPWVGRDIFGRPKRGCFVPKADLVSNELSVAKIEPFDLIASFYKVLSRSKSEIVHEVAMERISVGERINSLVDLARSKDRLSFTELVQHFAQHGLTKSNLIVTFLAILEMTKLKLLKIHQAAKEGDIYITSNQEGIEAFDEDSVADDYDEVASLED